MPPPLDPDLLATFLSEARGHLQRLREPALGPDERATAAHGLKGLARVVDLPALLPLTVELDESVRADDRAAVRRLLGAIETTLEQLEPPAVLESAQGDLRPEEQEILRRFFLEEAQEHLESAQRTLLSLAGQPDNRDLLAQLFRTLHTVKGAAGTVGLPEVGEAAHLLEDRIAELQARGGEIDAEPLDTLLSGLDTLRAMIESGLATEGASALLERLKDDLRAPADARHHPAPAPQAAAEEGDRPAAERRLEDRRGGEKQVIRVDVERVDELMDAVGELVFDRTRIERRVLELHAVGQDITQARGFLRDALAALRHQGHPLCDRLGEIDADLSEGTGRLERALAGLGDEAEALRRTAALMQDKLQRVRMMPLRWLFARLDRLVREAARAERKQVVLQTFGEATELDKSVVDQIGDPLSQLLRNSVAHGIEDPPRRVRAGKPAAGRIVVEARQRGEFVYIEVADDGQGIDPALVRERLVALGRVSPEQAGALDDDRAVAAIFERGFSTRAAADRLAGRGIGLDVVRESLSRLGGDITVASKPAAGTRFTIRLPLTTAIAQALLFKVGGQVYALPAAHVLESAQVAGLDGRTAQLRDQTLPVVDLHLLLGADPPATRRRTLIALAFGDQRFAVTCDKIVGPRQIVVKSVGPLLKPLPLYAGATISGAGKVQLILDLAALAAELGRDPALAFGRELPAPAPRRPRILVADDSRSVREAVSLILEAAGYRVDAVPDGWEAWEALQDGAYDLLLTDLEMPRLAGTELIAKLRRDVDLRSLPVLVISSRTAQPSRARAEAAGAQGFIAKPVNRRLIVDRVAEALRKRS
ncbi:MAG TPA: response regulator [Polyangia bacterium]|nr:response regulator [Polyangia bacterium]